MSENISGGLQLAKTAVMEKIAFPARAERKMDDVRVMMLDGKFYTRTGKLINLPETKARVHNAVGLMVDLAVTLHSGKMEDRPTVSGMLNSAMKGGTINEDLLYFNIIDMLPTDVYLKRMRYMHYADRLHSIRSFAELNEHNHFRTIPSWDVRHLDDLQTLYDKQIDEGYEGLVVKHYEDRYTYKRTKHWARFKATYTADLLCVGTTKGQGKYEGMIGALMLEGVVKGKEITVKTGSGLTDEDRSKRPSEFISKTVEMKYNSITKDKTTGVHSLFLPRFVTVRFDK